jgi:cell wall-associated NlpC family hydrolase
MVATAQRFLGAPYHWGGRTFAGLDCSALVQLAGARVGVRLPRDARDQCAAAGGPRRLRPLADALAARASRGPRPGNAWFFGPGDGDVTHVALATGGLGLIHAYGRVSWGSLDPLSPVFEPELFRSVLGWGELA